MLRTLVAILLLANVLFFAWAHGWLGPTPRHAEREPERLQAQVRPDALTVLPPPAASLALQAAHTASQQCLESGPFGDADIASAEAALAPASLPDGSWARVDSAPVAPWLVFAGRYPEEPLRKAREEDLRKLKLEFELIEAPADLAPGFVLSRQASRDGAEAWLKQHASAALRGVRVVQLPKPSTSWRLRVARADGDQAERLRALPGEALAGGFRPCAARP